MRMANGIHECSTRGIIFWQNDAIHWPKMEMANTHVDALRVNGNPKFHVQNERQNNV